MNDLYYLTGIMLLEKQLLCNVESARPAKRPRGTATPLPESTVAWVELTRWGLLLWVGILKSVGY